MRKALNTIHFLRNSLWFINHSGSALSSNKNAAGQYKTHTYIVPSLDDHTNYYQYYHHHQENNTTNGSSSDYMIGMKIIYKIWILPNPLALVKPIGGSSRVLLAITVHSPYPLTVPARTPKI